MGAAIPARGPVVEELGSPWPTSAQWSAAGVVQIAGVALTDLATEYGTPVYLLDETEFRTRAQAWRAAFTEAFAQIGTEAVLYYAGKALLTKAVARWAIEEGLNLDTASEGELAVALAAGVPGDRLGLHGNNKSDAELLAAIEHGVGQVIVDSLAEVDRLTELAEQHSARVPVLIRVTTGVHAGGHEYISTAHEDQKFGLSVTPVPGCSDSPAMLAALRVLHRPSLRLIGIHSHIGSQIFDPTGFLVAARGVLRLRAEIAARTGHLVPEVDLGGGYGIAYLPGQQSMRPKEIAGELALAVAQSCAELGTPLPKVAIEPGRCLVGPAGVTLYTVGTVKPVTVGAQTQTGDPFTRLYVSTDGGMSDNIRPALYGAQYHAELVSRRSQAPLVPARVVGKHCESGDILVREVKLPVDIAPGDLLAIPATGAYGRSMASNYNQMPRPGVVAIREGRAYPILRRETVADLLALDIA